HDNGKVRDVLHTGMGARDEPLMLEITTAGEERADSVCKAERDYGAQVLEGDVEDESFFAYIAEIDKDDDWRDLSVYERRSA
ncbi:MAG: terminase large subunit, partial [Gemmatimonadetes bacterium]|nr:terminase large subunit [Gemmatimonadota bacterium]